MVTHYAKPIGYISPGVDFPGACGPHAAGGSGPITPGQAACGRDCQRVPHVTAGDFQASSSTSKGPPGGGATGGKTSLLPTQPHSSEGSRFVVAAVSCILERQPEQFEGLRGSRVRERSRLEEKFRGLRAVWTKSLNVNKETKMKRYIVACAVVLA